MKKQNKPIFKTTTREESSLLLYLETCAVDRGGRVNLSHMNAEDIAIAERWAKEKHIQFGRVAFQDISAVCGSTHYVHLGPQAWKWVAGLRQLRASKAWAARRYALADEITSED